MKKRITCPVCDGLGICKRCSGTRYVMKGFPFKRQALCDSCNGMGQCNFCEGSGRVDAPALGKIDLNRGSLGVEVAGGRFYPLIAMGSQLPVEHKEIFSTAAHSQNYIEMHFVFGQDIKTENNKSLGKIRLMGIPPAAGGVPRVELTIRVDQDGDISLSAMERGTGKEVTVTEG